MQSKSKPRFAKLTLASLAGALALGGASATIARAETSSDDAATVQALGAAKLTLADAIRTAEAAGQGMVTGAEFTMKDGKPVFDVTTRNGAVETDHLIDPATGAILASTPDMKDAEGDSGDETAELAMLQTAKVNLLQAISAAEGQGGKALSAEFGQEEDGALAIQVEVADAAGKTVELKVDATTGKVIAAADDEEGENGENGENGEGGEEQEG